RRTILEVLRTNRRPRPKLSLVPSKCLAVDRVRVGAHGLAPCGASQRGIEVIFLLLQQKQRQIRGPRVPCPHLVCCLDRRRVIAGEETRLQLPDPVEAFQDSAGGLIRRSLLEGTFREQTIVERAELPGASA